MTIYDLLILQFIAHLLADYTFQPESWAKEKIANGFHSKYLIKHILIALVLSWGLSFQWQFIVASLIIAVFHLIIDGLKKNITNNKNTVKYAFVIDQALHLLVFVVCTFLFNHYFTISPYVQLPVTTHLLMIIAGYILCTKPANIIIKEVINFYDIRIAQDVSSTRTESEILNAGKLIGVSERILTLTLILYGQFEAVGFIIAGKSILRFKETDTSKTEYVLIGTLLSFGIAILTGIGILILKSKLT